MDELVSDDEDDEYASRAAVAAAIRALAPADIVRLRQLAGFLCSTRLRGTSTEPDELLHDAIVMTSHGKRRWRFRRVTIIRHLDRVMESHSGHAAEKRATHPTRSTTEADLDTPDRTNPGSGAPESSVHARAEARDELEALRRLFADDVEAFQVLECRGQGMEGMEIQRALGIDKARYAAVSKRILRVIAKYSCE